jgi:tetratricopeptide (TPR) repeat protein/DNA-binding XRE family transcriptional regulator
MVKKATQATPNRLLRRARKERGWTQRYVADQIGAPLALNVTRWEGGTAVPSAYYARKLCELFEKTPRELGLLAEEEEDVTTIPPLPATTYWNVPYQRNPFFTGREDILAPLHRQLTTTQSVAISQSAALSGLGGIGKTQLAIEYAYRYREEYRAIFWVRAASYDTLISDYVALAKLVELPGSDNQDQTQIVAAAKRWLTHHKNWLLILDNADELSLIVDFIPEGNSGHLLLTTRSQATGQIAQSFLVDTMKPEEACLLLLRRAKQLLPGASLDAAPQPAQEAALAIAQELGGLPLALDQAGAYIEETGCSLQEYLALFRRRRMYFLQRQSEAPSAYPHTVASTWSLAFQKIEAANPAAAELLHLLAFLDPDAIPETLFTEAAPTLGPVLEPIAADTLLWNEAIQTLRRFSLIKRNPETKQLTIHRLVQAILKENMDEPLRRQRAEQVVRAVDAVFPESDFAVWPRCQEYLPQALACMQWIEEYHLAFPEAAHLLHLIGKYLIERGHYAQAEAPLQRALTSRDELLGEHPDTVATLEYLALLFERLGRYEQSEALLQRALTIQEQIRGPSHPNTAITLTNLALIFLLRSKYEQSEALLQRALTIQEHVLETEDLHMAETLDTLARLSYLQGQYERSEALVTRALTIIKHVRGPEHPDTGVMLDNLAYLSRFQGKYEKAEKLHQRAISIKEHTIGPEHPELAFSLDNLASVYQLQGKYEQARPLYQRALAIREQGLSPQHPDTATTLDNLAQLSHIQGEYSQAKALHLRALAIREQALGPKHIDTTTSQINLADVYTAQQKYAQAEQLYRQALTIREQTLNPQHPDIATALDHLATLYRLQGRSEQAQPLYQRALTIRKQALGANHPDTIATRAHLSDR